jgi:CDP-diacylglycerol--glycerol-3-phosphate 3-phosphatidyltransferase
MINQIPKALIFLRLSLGVMILIFSIFQIKNYSSIALILFSAGMLTDVFDGIIVRRLNISSESLRRLDSTIDQLFFISIAVATFIQSPQFFYQNKIKLIILLSAEMLAYLVCFLKFKKEIATHSILSKVWALILFATILQIMITRNSTALFEICFYAGVITRLEIITIILVLKKWTNDVPGLYQAILIRQGKTITRHKLFNG